MQEVTSSRLVITHGWTDGEERGSGEILLPCQRGSSLARAA